MKRYRKQLDIIRKRCYDPQTAAMQLSVELRGVYGEVILVDRETLNSITIPLPEHGGSEDYNYVEEVEWQSDNELLLLRTDKSPGTPEGGFVKQLI